MTNYKKIDYVIENLSPINFSEKSVDSIFMLLKNIFLALLSGGRWQQAILMKII